MDDLDPDTVRMRAWEAIERTAGVKARLAERAERRQWQRSDLAASQPPPAPLARERAPTRPEGRDWQAEAIWINSLIDVKIAGLRSEIAEGVGQVIANERATLKRTLDRLRTEIRGEFVKALDEARTQVLRGYAADDLVARFDRSMAKIDALLARLECRDAVRGLGLAGDLLPN